MDPPNADSNEKPNLCSLPDELLILIFQEMASGAGQRKDRERYTAALRSIASFARTCKVFNMIARDERQWARLLISRFGKSAAPFDAFTNVPPPPPPPAAAARRTRGRVPPTIPQISGRLMRQMSEQLQLQITHHRPADAEAETGPEAADHVIVPIPIPMSPPLPPEAKPLPTKMRANPNAAWREAYQRRHEAVKGRIRRREEEEAVHNRPSHRAGRFVRDILCCEQPQYNSYFGIAGALGIIPLLLSVLVALKLDGVILASWGWVLTPIWVASVLVQFAVCFLRIDESWFTDFENDWDDWFNDGRWMDVLAFCCQAVLLIFPIFLVVQGDGLVQWSWGVTFIPVYVIFGILEVIVCISLGSWANDELYDWDDVQENPLMVFIVIFTLLGAVSLIPFVALLPIWLDGNLEATVTFFHICIPLWISVVLLAIPAKIVMGAYTLIPWAVLVFLPFGVTPLLIGLKVEGVVSGMAWSVTLVPVIAALGIATVGVCLMVVLRVGPMFDDSDDEEWNDPGWHMPPHEDVELIWDDDSELEMV